MHMYVVRTQRTFVRLFWQVNSRKVSRLFAKSTEWRTIADVKNWDGGWWEEKSYGKALHGGARWGEEKETTKGRGVLIRGFVAFKWGSVVMINELRHSRFSGNYISSGWWVCVDKSSSNMTAAWWWISPGKGALSVPFSVVYLKSGLFAVGTNK